MTAIEFFRNQAYKRIELRASYYGSTNPFEQVNYNELGKELEHYAKAIAALELLEELNLKTN